MTAYKNFWSLNTDEAVVTGILRENTNREIEVFMPLNAQMKDIDLIALNLNIKKVATIQIKGSKAYEPAKNILEKYEEGSFGWFFFDKNVIQQAKADFFIFLIYVIRENTKTGRRVIEPHTITIPTETLKEFCLKYKKLHPDRYSFYIWINPKKKISMEYRDEEYDLTEYLDKNGFEKLNKYLLKND